MPDDKDYEVQVGNRKGLVVLSFTQPIKWIGLPPAIARELANLILANAGQAEAEADANEEVKKEEESK